MRLDIPGLALALTLAALSAAAGPATAQQRLDRPLRVFLDCASFRCDPAYFLEEIPWVVFVRDRQDADVHVLGTRQQTGAGGGAYSFDLRGRGAFEGDRLRLTTTTPADATEDARREALVEVVRIGLVPFAQATPVAPAVNVATPEEATTAAAAEHDPWNRWTFRFGVDAFMNGESQQSSRSVSASTSANRITREWKTLLSLRSSVDRSEFQLDESTTFTSGRESYGGGAVVVRSLGEHWGAGGVLDWNRSSFANYDASVVVGPAVEYNVFPYTESTRRLLTILYAFGPRHNDYASETIFGATRETLLEHVLIVSYDVTQPWGNIDVSAQFEHFISRLGAREAWEDPQFSGQLGGGFNLRLLRGLSARLFGRVAMVRNQIHLPVGELTEEEILTRQRELATNYRYFASMGLTYRFGSIFSDVVNPRFRRLD